MRAGRAVLLVALLHVAAALAQPPAPDSEEQRRYQALTQELRCLVCQNQTIADSAAPLAADLREQVLRQLREGRSDDEIRDFMTARYGDYVLYRPPFKPATLALWLAPPAAVLLALAMVWRHTRRRVAAPAAVDPAAVARVLGRDPPPGTT